MTSAARILLTLPVTLSLTTAATISAIPTDTPVTLRDDYTCLVGPSGVTDGSYDSNVRHSYGHLTR